MNFFARSLRSKLVGYFSALSLLTVSSVGAIALVESRRTLHRSIQEQLETTANLQEQTLDIWFTNQTERYSAFSQNSQLRKLSNTLLTESGSESEVEQAERDLFFLLKQFVDTNPGVEEIFLLDQQSGDVAFSTELQTLGDSYSEEDFFLEGRRQSFVMYPGEGNEDFLFSQPIKGLFQEFIGVLVVRLDASALAETVLQFHNPEALHFNYIVTPENYPLTADQSLFNSWQNSADDNDIIQEAIAGNSGVSRYQNILDQNVFGMYRWLPEYNLALFVELGSQQALAPLTSLVWKVVGFGVGVIGLAIAGSWVIAKLIAKPILAIKDTATAVTQGDLKLKAPKYADDEIGVLADAFNMMTEEFDLLYEEFQGQVTQLEMAEISAQHSYHELQEEKRKVDAVMKKLGRANEEITLLNERLKTENIGLAAEIQATNERLNQFLEAIPVGILVFDGEGEVVYFNRKAQLLLTDSESVAIEHIVDYPLRCAETHTPYPPDKMLGQRALTSKESNTYDDLEIYHKDHFIPIEAWETPILDEEGVVRYAIVAFQDITERRQAEQEKQEYTQRLLELNQANERFVPRQFLYLLEKHSIVDVKLGDNVQKEMTVLFADIRGFTTLSEQMSPEDNFKFINAFLSRMNPAISSHSGFIDKYIGDAIMALFSKEAHADDALKAAIAMLRTLNDYNKTRQRPDRRPIRIGLGLNSGLMRCGTVGGDQHMESTVISDAVNLASRLERLTKIYRTSLLISHHTFLRLENHEDYHIRLIDNVTVTGKSIAVSVYEVFDVDPPAIARAKKANRVTFEQGFVLYRLKQFVKAQRLFQKCLYSCPEDYVSQLYVERCQQNMMNYLPAKLVDDSFLDGGKF